MELPIRMNTIAQMAGLKPVVQNLGYANGFVKTPTIVEKCGHEKTDKIIGNCLVERTCLICGYTYKIDSSG